MPGIYPRLYRGGTSDAFFGKFHTLGGIYSPLLDVFLASGIYNIFFLLSTPLGVFPLSLWRMLDNPRGRVAWIYKMCRTSFLTAVLAEVVLVVLDLFLSLL